MWHQEATDLVCKEWAAGASATAISVSLFDTFSLPFRRNAVIGKIHRMGLSARERKATPRISTPRQSAPRRTKQYAERIDPIQPAIEVPNSQRKTLLQLKPHHCRWPYGDPGTGDFYFCGGESVEGKPYCIGHCRQGYRVRT